MDQQIGTNGWLCSVTCFGGCLVGCRRVCSGRSGTDLRCHCATAVNATATTIT